jgi:hypothetical protein
MHSTDAGLGNAALSWNLAQQKCEAAFGHLVVYDDYEEQKMVSTPGPCMSMAALVCNARNPKGRCLPTAKTTTNPNAPRWQVEQYFLQQGKWTWLASYL